MLTLDDEVRKISRINNKGSMMCGFRYTSYEKADGHTIATHRDVLTDIPLSVHSMIFKPYRESINSFDSEDVTKMIAKACNVIFTKLIVEKLYVEHKITKAEHDRKLKQLGLA